MRVKLSARARRVFSRRLTRPRWSSRRAAVTIWRRDARLPRRSDAIGFGALAFVAVEVTRRFANRVVGKVSLPRPLQAESVANKLPPRLDGCGATTPVACACRSAPQQVFQCGQIFL